MNTTIKEHWVAALRSGDYPQTRGALHRTAPGHSGAPAGFCCLGVLCELAVADGVTQRFDDRGLELLGEVGYLATNSNGGKFAETALLPREVMEWAGLDWKYGIRRGDEPVLTDLNDMGTPFAEIADIIEREA